MKTDKFTLGIIFENNSIFNKTFSKINLKDKSIMYFVENNLYQNCEIFLETLKDNVNAIIYIREDDYITDLMKNNNFKEDSAEYILSNSLTIPIEYFKIPFNITRTVLNKLETEIDRFYKERINKQ